MMVILILMQRDKPTDVRDPVDSQDVATNKYVDETLLSSSELAKNADLTYVDQENAKQDIAIADEASKNDLDQTLNFDGSNSMADH